VKRANFFKWAFFGQKVSTSLAFQACWTANIDVLHRCFSQSPQEFRPWPTIVKKAEPLICSPADGHVEISHTR
jgi:hypothetical protein